LLPSSFSCRSPCSKTATTHLLFALVFMFSSYNHPPFCSRLVFGLVTIHPPTRGHLVVGLVATHPPLCGHLVGGPIVIFLFIVILLLVMLLDPSPSLIFHLNCLVEWCNLARMCPCASILAIVWFRALVEHLLWLQG
jgi:hypothetical protein